MWQAPHKEEQRSLQPGSARGYPSQENYQGPKRPADTRRFRLDGALAPNAEREQRVQFHVPCQSHAERRSMDHTPAAVGEHTGAERRAKPNADEPCCRTITVTVSMPGATPEEVHQSFVIPLERQLRFVDGIEAITSTAVEGSGKVVSGAWRRGSGASSGAGTRCRT